LLLHIVSNLLNYVVGLEWLKDLKGEMNSRKYIKRDYRTKTTNKALVSFQVVVKETDLWISADKYLKEQARNLVLDCRQQLETYIHYQPEFATTLTPYGYDAFAPTIVKKMIQATKELNVGPMAAVAGTIAQYTANGLLKLSDQVIVENGGDIYLKANRPMTVSIFAGDSPLSEKLGILIPERLMPVGICSSSGKVGHSLSFGTSDVVCLLSHSAALADGAATALGNLVKTKNDLQIIAELANTIDGILGGIVILEDSMSTWGEIQLVEL